MDFETDQSDPNTCNPVQLSSVMINPRTLEFIPDSEFNSYIKPPSIDDEGYIDKHKDTIAWHAKVLGKTEEEVLEIWRNAPSEKDVFDDFCNYLLRYHTRGKNKNKFSSVVASGWNIHKFDMPIMKRLCIKYGKIDKDNTMTIFHPRNFIDGIDYCFAWFENTDLKSYSLDSICSLLGLKNENAHDSMSDVYTTSIIIQRFLKLTRKCSKMVKFEDSCKSVKFPGMVYNKDDKASNAKN